MIVRDTDARFVIDPVSGEITNNSEKDSITQGSHNSEVFTFELPRDIGHDMMNCNLVEVHYINIKAKDKTQTSEGIYKVNDLQVCPEDDRKVILSWTIDGSATVHQGTLSFSIHFKCISDDGKCLYRWPTKTFNKMGVTSCVDTTDAVMEENQDIIAEWEARISALEENGGGGGGGAATPYFVDVQYSEEGCYINDFSWGDLHAEIGSERMIVCRVESREDVFHLPMTNVNDYEERVVFSADIGYDHHEVEVLQDGTVVYTVEDRTGDISAALDHIIAIQEELIGR